MKLRYSVDERPGLGATLLYGLQWLMICIPVVLTSTFIAPVGEVVCFTQKLFAVMGATMIVQALWGHRLPLVAGPATVLLMGVVAAASQGYTPQSIYPAMVVGGAVVTLLALSGLLRHLLPIFTPRIVVAIVVLISFTMSKPIVGMIFSDASHQGTVMLFALVCIGAMAFANKVLHGIWKSMVVIVAMSLGALIYYCITGFPSQLTTDTVAPSLLLKDMKLDAGVLHLLYSTAYQRGRLGASFGRHGRGKQYGRSSETRYGYHGHCKYVLRCYGHTGGRRLLALAGHRCLHFVCIPLYDYSCRRGNDYTLALSVGCIVPAHHPDTRNGYRIALPDGNTSSSRITYDA